MIEQVERLLKQLIGLDAESIGRPVVERVVQQRMVALGMSNATDYAAQLSLSAPEQQALVEAIVVPETWFFRYPESFVALAQLAQKRYAELAVKRPLRVLSLPCSSGEEPYSIAMALLDAGLPPAAFCIEALDVSAKVLELARLGHYGRNSFRGQALGFRERYFSATDSGFQLQTRVLQQVRLRCGNVLDNAVLRGEAVFDVVFCRNLLIYFDRPTQHAVLDELQRLLSDDGIFFVGPAEASLLTQRGMQALGVPLTFAFKRVATRAVAPAAPASKPTAPRSVPVAAPRAMAAQLAVATPTMAISRAVTPVSAVSADPAATALSAIAALADAGLSAEALQACEQYLHAYGPHADVFYWTGLLSDMAGQSERAQEHYRKALYLEPEHVASLVHLAALLAARGDHQGAQRLQQRASRTGRSGVKRDGR